MFFFETQCICMAGMICATLVNRQTHRQLLTVNTAGWAENYEHQFPKIYQSRMKWWPLCWVTLNAGISCPTSCACQQLSGVVLHHDSALNFTWQIVRVRPIPVSGIGWYSPVLVGIGIIWVSAPIPVALSFVYLSQQSTLLQRMPIVSSLYRIFAHTPCIHI